MDGMLARKILAEEYEKSGLVALAISIRNPKDSTISETVGVKAMDCAYKLGEADERVKWLEVVQSAISDLRDHRAISLVIAILQSSIAKSGGANDIATRNLKTDEGVHLRGDKKPLCVQEGEYLCGDIEPLYAFLRDCGPKLSGNG
jgi:hypothetical protein